MQQVLNRMSAHKSGRQVVDIEERVTAGTIIVLK